MQPVGQLVSGPVAVAIGISSTLYLAAGLALVLFAGVLAVPAVRNFSPASSRRSDSAGVV
jgi:ABC-type nickel/cobalt efflux system permease component RcnA